MSLQKHNGAAFLKVLILNQLQHIRWLKVTSLLELDKEIFGKYFSWPWPWSAHLKSVISRQTYQRPKFATIWRSRGDVSEKEEEWHRDLIRFEFGRKINLGIVRTYDLEARYLRKYGLLYIDAMIFQVVIFARNQKTNASWKTWTRLIFQEANAVLCLGGGTNDK